MRGTLAAGAVLLGLAASPQASATLERERLFEAAASVLKIEVSRQQGGYSLGSGVVVGPGRVVTNCHVTQSAVGISVVRGDERWRVESQARDPGHDLCVLKVPQLRAPSVAIGQSTALQAGQAVAAVGFTGGQGLQNSTGQVVDLHRLDGGYVIQSDNWFSSGASGGALFDEQMRLVGVLTFRLRGGQLHYFASPVEWLQPLLAEGADYRAVAPANPVDQYYWQRQPPAQPAFLQAAALQRDLKWPELESLARRWGEADATDPAPLNALARALEGMGRLGDAMRALEQSLKLAPSAAGTWLHLGQLALREGQLAKAREIRQRLDTLAPALAATLVVPGAAGR
jgi:hypothetical protein